MSMTLMVKAMETKVGNPLRKLVLIKLADNANDKGECWPSHQHIADQCEISKRSVINHIKALEAMGLVRVEHRIVNNEKRSNLYHLNLTGGSAKDSPPSAKDSLPSSAGDAHRTSHSFESVNESTPIPPKGADEVIPLKKILDAYHEKLPELPRVVVFTDKRKKQLSARWKEDKSRQTIEWWTGYFEYVSSIPFLNGQNNRSWKADFEWLTNQNNLAKVIEGKYENE